MTLREILKNIAPSTYVKIDCKDGEALFYGQVNVILYKYRLSEVMERKVYRNTVIWVADTFCTLSVCKRKQR